MKIISGSLKGRNVLGYHIDGTRPTMDRVKESIFSMIQNDLKESIVLDLFAGSGNLGFEAISNGASFCYFVDKNPQAIKTIKQNSSNFQTDEKIQTYVLDYRKALKLFKEQNIKFNIVFLDPPYHEKILIDLLNTLVKEQLLEKEASVVVEMEENSIGASTVPSLNLIKSRSYGAKQVNIYKEQS